MAVRYFTARIRDNGSNIADRQRQSTYIDALCANGILSLHEGHFLKKTRRCHTCGATWPDYEEKISDVNIAVELLMDAVDDRFDTAIIVSGDSDLSTPVRRVLARFPPKRVIVAFPPKRRSAELRNAATASFKIGADKLKKSLLPDPVVTPAGISLSRPPGWRWQESPAGVGSRRARPEVEIPIEKLQWVPREAREDHLHSGHKMPAHCPTGHRSENGRVGSPWDHHDPKQPYRVIPRPYPGLHAPRLQPLQQRAYRRFCRLRRSRSPTTPHSPMK